MRIIIILLSAFALCSAFVITASFRSEQKKNARVKGAYTEKWQSLKKLLSQNSIDTNDVQVFIRGFKKEKDLEVWAKGKTGEYKLIKTYDFCALSGELGPKRKQGDYQVPEGFYTINIFNPYSNYYLSLGVSYPNQSDRIIGGKGDLGGAIMIHGNCVTIGCIPITDDKIKELYVLTVESKANGHEVPVHLFPARLSDEGMKELSSSFDDKKLIDFWKNLQPGYKYFEQNKKLPNITVAKDGKYVVN